MTESKKSEKGVTDEELSRHNRREAEHEPVADPMGRVGRNCRRFLSMAASAAAAAATTTTVTMTAIERTAQERDPDTDDGPQAGSTLSARSGRARWRRSQHVALVMGGRHNSADGDTSGGSPLEMTLLAARCLENLASQSLTMVEFLIRHGAVRSLGLQLQPDHWVQHVYASDTLQHERSRSGDRNEIIVSSAELQRQCIATLSAFALALPGNTELRVELMQCEQPRFSFGTGEHECA